MSQEFVLLKAVQDSCAAEAGQWSHEQEEHMEQLLTAVIASLNARQRHYLQELLELQCRLGWTAHAGVVRDSIADMVGRGAHLGKAQQKRNLELVVDNDR